MSFKKKCVYIYIGLQVQAPQVLGFSSPLFWSSGLVVVLWSSGRLVLCSGPVVSLPNFLIFMICWPGRFAVVAFPAFMVSWFPDVLGFLVCLVAWFCALVAIIDMMN